ncbi:MAG: hypothetical protein M2R45_02850 [Verrucomicrobia subdivision 3 bacterium]|nr:hypothetical protein [Limisphaerales bacterium]MCS1415447.1 hypothetical protein [Limisphaerales bacterium]
MSHGFSGCFVLPNGHQLVPTGYSVSIGVEAREQFILGFSERVRTGMLGVEERCDRQGAARSECSIRQNLVIRRHSTVFFMIGYLAISRLRGSNIHSSHLHFCYDSESIADDKILADVPCRMV